MTEDLATAALIVPGDVRTVPVAELGPALRAGLDCADGDFAVLRPGLRSPPRIVDSATAGLLAEFSEPTRIVDGVIRFSRARGLDAERTLEAAFPALQLFAAGGILVAAGTAAARPIEPSLVPGQLVAGFEVVRAVQALEDTELYEATAAEGGRVALKLARPEFAVLGLELMTREAAALRLIGGRHAPELVATGMVRDRPYLATSWCAGVPATTAAHGLRARGADDELHALCRAVLDAYAAVHACGVLHGDVHPGNVLAAASGGAVLVDFGCARTLGADEAPPPRVGVATYYEPEVARALLAGRPAPPPTAAGEQYAVAALLYALLTGAAHLDFRYEPEAVWRQIATESPLPFRRRGRPAWPRVERVLARALAHDPAARFADLAALRDAFADARPPRLRRRPGAAGRRLLAATLGEITAASGPDVAWAQYRFALAREDPLALLDAERTALAAGDHVLLALVGRAAGDGRRQAESVRALALSPPGLLDAALVLEALGPREPLAAAVRDAIAASWRAPRRGRASTLHTVLRAVRASGAPEPPGLRAEILAAASQAPPRAIGWARGSAGLVHLWTLAHDAFGDPALLDRAERDGHRVASARAVGADLHAGAAGRAFALLRLHQYTGEAAWLDAAIRLAERAARTAEGAPIGDLARGRLGVALLAAELEHPAWAAHPRFGLEGWPS
jgi:serine/threonine-protein kinase